MANYTTDPKTPMNREDRRNWILKLIFSCYNDKLENQNYGFTKLSPIQFQRGIFWKKQKSGGKQPIPSSENLTLETILKIKTGSFRTPKNRSESI